MPTSARRSLDVRGERRAESRRSRSCRRARDRDRARDVRRRAARRALAPRELVEARSARGATITRLPDGSLRIRGDGIDKDTLTIVLWTDLPAVRGLRLEALPDEELGAEDLASPRTATSS
jgi:hypothetical protein